MRETSVEICIIGAGAAGLWAARVAAAHGRRDVLVLEKTRRTGTKVLASGGTKCNLTTTLDGPAAAELFGPRGARFLRTAFRALPPAAVREAFAEWGVATVEAPLEKIFPRTGKAVHVRDALERSARSAGVRIELEAGVTDIQPHAGRFRVTTPDRVVVADRVLVCAGGKSYPSTGTIGEAYDWLARLGCEIVEPVPALVPLTSSDHRVRELTGIAIQDVVATLRDTAGKRLCTRSRPVLFTHHGVSGPGAMDPSGLVARAGKNANFRLELDLVPAHDREALRHRLVDAARDEGAKRLAHVLPVELPKRLFDLVAARSGVPSPTLRVSELTKSTRHALIETLKALPIPIDGTLGFDKAEVTAGGLAIDEVDPGTMAVRRQPGLFACGEVLDVDGPIGGLNFQSAFATAELAGRAIAEARTSG